MKEVKPKFVFRAVRWDDVIGVEWGSGKNLGPEYGDIDRCYELYYTVPDDLRRPWKVTNRQPIPYLFALNAPTPTSL